MELYGSSEFYYPFGIEWSSSPAGVLTMVGGEAGYDRSTGLALFDLAAGASGPVTLTVRAKAKTQ